MNKDGTVNVSDTTIVTIAFNSKSGNIKRNPIADLDGNGGASIIDISRVAKEYGKIMPPILEDDLESGNTRQYFTPSLL